MCNPAQEKILIKVFVLIRHVDVTGISGTGKIAVGTQWPDGTCTMFWLNTKTTGFYWSLEQLQEIHCYSGNAHIEFTYV